MAIRDEDLFEATSRVTVLQRTGLAPLSVKNLAMLTGTTLIPFLPLPFIAIPPATLLQYLKRLLF